MTIQYMMKYINVSMTPLKDMHACITNNKINAIVRACSIDIGADVALSALINIQSLKLHINFVSLFK